MVRKLGENECVPVNQPPVLLLQRHLAEIVEINPFPDGSTQQNIANVFRNVICFRHTNGFAAKEQGGCGRRAIMLRIVTYTPCETIG